MQIFDPVRRKNVALTPEEWVRQHLIQYLNESLAYPLSLLSIEKSLTLNGMTKRYDLVAHGDTGFPALLAECKAPDVNITQDTFEQIARYNLILKVEWLVVTNGLETYCARVDLDARSVKFIPQIPRYDEILA